MSDDARKRLAADQARLVAALSGRDEPPTGFDAARIDLTARTLASKRRSGIAKTWPALAGSLDEHFAAFSAASSPDPAGPAADGFAFAEWLDARGSLPPPALRVLVAAQLGRGGPIGLRLRSGVVGIRLPLLGIRLLFRR